MYIDSHTHFDLCLENKNLTEEAIIQGLRDNKIARSVQISIDPSGFQWSLDFAEKYRDDGILLSLGIHPSSNADEKNLIDLSRFIEKVMRSKSNDLLFGVGETGLDYYRMRQPKKMQLKSFEKQVSLARKWKLPIIVHSREAMDDTLQILRKSSPDRGIMHCFSGDRKIAKEVLELGFYISFAGNLTYRNATILHDAAAYIPPDRILLETDAPFLTPTPYRGNRNEPSYIIQTAQEVAKLKGISFGEISYQTSKNVCRLFNLSFLE